MAKLKFIHSRPENLGLQAEDEQWPLGINRNKLRPKGRSSRRLIIFIIIVTITVSTAPYLMASEIQTLNFDSLSDKDISPEGRSALSLFEKDWKHTETEHFIYHFIDEKGAETVLIHAEVYYKWIKDIFGVEEDKWAKKSHVFIFPDEKMWNDFKTKINFHLPTAAAFTTGWELFMYRDPHWISPRLTLAHEITHIIVFRFVNGPIPIFLKEGFAEFISYKAIAMQLTGGNIGFIVLIPESEFIPLEELIGMVSYAGDKVDTLYQESELLVRFLILNYGNKKFYTLLREASIGKPFKGSIEDIYKMNFKTFEEKFKAYAISKK